MSAVKEQVLANLKTQWKVAVEKQFQEEPDKIRNVNMQKNAREIMANPIVRLASRRAGITVEDIERILTEIRDEVCEETVLPSPNPFSHGRFETEQHLREIEKGQE